MTAISLGRLHLQLTYDTTPRVPNTAADGVLPLSPGVLGELWSSSFHRRLNIQTIGANVLAWRGNGTIIGFTGSSGVYTSSNDINDRLVSIGGGHRYINAADQSQETYDARGFLSSIAWASGGIVTFTYSDSSTPPTLAPGADYLLQATDENNRSVGFRYNASGRLNQILDLSGQAISLAYDAQNNLQTIGWQDSKNLGYVYENVNHPWALTGVIDESGTRKSSFGYDAQGRANKTESAGGVNRFEAAYAQAPSVSVSEFFDSDQQALVRTYAWVPPQGAAVTTPLGTTMLGAALLNSKPYQTSQSQPAGSGCSASTSAQSYDANGNVSQRDDFNGKRICYANDLSRNLETARVEGLANTATCSTLITPGVSIPTGSRKVSTQWHPDWRLATKVAEPGKLTTSIYNGQPDPFNGNAIASCAPGTALLPDGKPIVVLCKQVEQATTDANGASGFSATLQAGVANRTTSWTYNQFGQVLTENGPRTDVSDITTYSYYTSTTADYTVGDLQSVTNAAGKTITFNKYNKHGQVLQSTDPNGVVTTNTYDLRQRLKSTSVAGQATSYDYDAVGQLKKVTQPDGSWLGYDYDDAHRQTAMYDNLGNRVDYTLDNAGNKTAETVKNNAAVLKRQLSRSIDALGRVQQTTGRE